MVIDSSPTDKQTSIIIMTGTRDRLKECKHGGNTYDDVINKLLKFHHTSTGSTIVE